MRLRFDDVIFFISGLFLPALLFVSGTYFLIRVGRFVFDPKFFKSLMRREKGISETNTSQGGKKHKRSSFSSLCLALAGTLGVGNISGVAAAITVGGPGAVFWIWVSSIVASVLKYAETVLAVRYRVRDAEGFRGGAHLYIKNGLKAPWLSVIFCTACIVTSLTMGCVTQTKAAADGVLVATGVPSVICGAVFFILVLFLSFGGGEAISAFTLRLIPPLCLLYVILSLAVIFIFRGNIPYVTSVIFSEAFREFPFHINTLYKGPQNPGASNLLYSEPS